MNVDPSDFVFTAMGTTKEEYTGVPDISDSMAHESELYFSLIDSLDVTLDLEELEDESDRHQDVIGVYHASGTKCPRKSFYSEKDIVSEYPERDWEFGLEYIFRRGNTVEDWVEDTLEESLPDKVIKNEMPMKYEFGDFYVTGSTDPYILNQDGDLWAITEVKSTRNSLSNIPLSYHVRQLNVYLNIADIPYGFIIYLKVNDNFEEEEITIKDVEIVKIEKDEELFQRCMMAFTLYHDYRENGGFPPAFPVDDKECSDCRYRGLCYNDDKGDDYTKENFPPDQSVKKEDKTNFFRSI